MTMQMSEIGIDAGRLSVFALDLLRKTGPDEQTLNKIGSRLVAFGQYLPDMERPEIETPLWEDSDGTFELVLRPVKIGETSGFPERYDTWAIYTPQKGAISFSVNGQSATRLSLNDSAWAMPEDRVQLFAVESDAVVLCLYGISRKHLPDCI